MSQALLLLLEGDVQVEDHAVVLAGDHPARREGATVTDMLHTETQGLPAVPRAQEITVQGVDRPALGDGSHGCDEGLSHHLPAKQSLPLRVRLGTPELVLADLDEVEQLDQVFRGRGHPAIITRFCPSPARCVWLRQAPGCVFPVRTG